jgi:hypothetical protein
MNSYYAILKEFKTKWERRYKGRIFTPRPAHYKQLKDLLSPLHFESEMGAFEPLTLNDVVERIDIYLRNNYFERCGHNFSTFIKDFDMFVPPAPKAAPRPPAMAQCTDCGEVFPSNQSHQCKDGSWNKPKDSAIPISEPLKLFRTDNSPKDGSNA